MVASPRRLVPFVVAAALLVIGLYSILLTGPAAMLPNVEKAPPHLPRRTRGANNSEWEWHQLLYPERPCPAGQTVTVLWVVKKMFGSALWSGYDIADAINDRYEDIVTLPLRGDELASMDDHQVYAQLERRGMSSTTKRHVDMCLFVKYPNKELITRCRAMGAATAVLWVDGHPNLLQVSDYGHSVTKEDDIDYHILPNTLTTQHYSNAIIGREWVIPQHNSNMEGFRKSNVHEPVRYIGWQGNPLNRMSAQIRNAVSAWAKTRGIEFRELYYHGDEKPVDKLKQERVEAFKAVLSSIDVMIIFPSQEDTFEKLIYKPNGRNIFSLSMGIPTILYPYVSYTEALKWSQYPAFASNLPELLRWLDLVARLELSQLGLQFAESFSADNIARMWAYHLRSAFC